MNGTDGCRLALAGTLGLLSCGPIRALPPGDRARWGRCAALVIDARCAPTDTDGYARCARSLANQYALQRSGEERRSWLVGRGCPEVLVGPGRAAGFTISQTESSALGHVLMLEVRTTEYTVSLTGSALSLSVAVTWMDSARVPERCAEIEMASGSGVVRASGVRFVERSFLRLASGDISVGEMQRLVSTGTLDVRVCGVAAHLTPTQVEGVAVFLRRLGTLAGARTD